MLLVVKFYELAIKYILLKTKVINSQNITYSLCFTIIYVSEHLGVSLVAQIVKNLSIVQQTRVWSLGQGDPLEKGMETPCSILAWRIPWTEQPGRLQFMGSQRVRYNWVTNTFTLVPGACISAWWNCYR